MPRELDELITGGQDTRLQIRFCPESDQPALVSAAAEYQRLWEAEGERIVEQLAAATGLRFTERAIDARVFEGVSRSDPLRLRASYDQETKLGTLIHELAHRLVQGRRVGSALDANGPDRERENHELIDLFLFDVWTDLYGLGFAQRQVEIESQRRPMYRATWRATLTLSRVARTEKLRAMLRPPDAESSTD